MVTFIFHIFVELWAFENLFSTSAQEISAIIGHFPILKQQ